MQSFPSEPAMRKAKQGFTLIEILIVVAIVGILASLAYPSYRDHLIRGALVPAFASMSDYRVRMEQYYQDNRRYATAVNGTACAVALPTAKDFTFACAMADDQNYVLTATGSAGVSGFVYTINQANQMATTSTASGWGTSNTTCWIKRKGEC